MKPNYSKISKINVTYNNISINTKEKPEEIYILDNMEYSVSSNNIEKQEIDDVSASMAEDDALNEETISLMDNEQTVTEGQGIDHMDNNVEAVPQSGAEHSDLDTPPADVAEQVIIEEVNNTEDIEFMDNRETILSLEIEQIATEEPEEQSIDHMDNNDEAVPQSGTEHADIDTPLADVAEQVIIEEVNNTEDIEFMDNQETILSLEIEQIEIEESEEQSIELMDNKDESVSQSDTEHSDIGAPPAVVTELVIIEENNIEVVNITEGIEFKDYLEAEQNISEDIMGRDPVDSIYVGEDISYENSNPQSDTYIKKEEYFKITDIIDQQTSVCNDPSGNCSECCTIFTDARRTVFGYQAESVTCECHDICIEDVRDVCVKERTLRQVIPCTANGREGCRDGLLPDVPPEIQSLRVLCAEESLSPTTQCDHIINEVEFEVVLQFDNVLVVVTPRDEFACMFYEFARFPGGVFYSNDSAGEGLNQFRNELAQIDGSCKVIIIEDVSVEKIGNVCYLVIEYKVIDKLWKHENLLVSAIKPYELPGEGFNYTIKQAFEKGHKLGICPGGSCSGI